MKKEEIYFFKKKIFKKIKPNNLNNKFYKVLFSKISDLIIDEKDLTKAYSQEIALNINLDNYISFVNNKIDRLLEQFKKEKISIVFISEKVYFNQIKINNFFKSKSINAASIGINKKNLHHKNFKINLSLSLFEIIVLLSKLRNLKIFSQGWLFRYHLNYLIDFYKGSNTHILDVMDINSFLFPNYKKKKILALMKIVWGQDVKLNHELQLFSEKHLFKNSDKVLFPGSINHVEDLKLDTKKKFVKYFEFGSYPQKKYFAKPVIKKKYVVKKINFVFAGGIVPIDNRRVKEFFADAQFVSTTKIILSQGYKLTVFNNPLLTDDKNYEKLYKPHYKLMKQHKNYYKFCKGYVGKKVTKKIANYDLGLLIYDFNNTTLFGENHFKNMIPTKFFLYMEACLPVLVSSRWVYLSKIVKYYKLGYVVDDKNIYYLKNIIRKLDIKQLKKNVLNYRNIFKNYSQYNFLLR